MARYQREVEVAASPEVVFAVLADVAGWADWDPSVRSSAALDDGAPSVGARYEVTVGFYGRAIEQVHEIAELEAPRRLVVTTDGRARGRFEFELAPAGPATRLSWDATLELKGVARLLDRGLAVAFAGLGDNAVDGLTRRLAGSGVG